jgi:hypothetical protein
MTEFNLKTKNLLIYKTMATELIYKSEKKYIVDRYKVRGKNTGENNDEYRNGGILVKREHPANGKY